MPLLRHPHDHSGALAPVSRQAQVLERGQAFGDLMAQGGGVKH
jgi:hypothetical protein